MKLKIIFYLALSCLFLNSGYSQISVGRKKKWAFKDFRKGEYEVIKKKTTVFVVDDFMLEDFESILKDTWTVNQYLVIYRDDFEKNKETYIDEQYAIWELKALHKSITTVGGTSVLDGDYVYVYTDYYYLTNIIKDNGVTKASTYNEIAAVFLGGDNEAIWDFITTHELGDLSESFYNYQLGYMKNYLQVINDYLETKWFSYCYGKAYDKSKIKKLKKATLYVPEYIKLKTIGWNQGEIENPEELFKNYKYKFQFISDDELNNMILNANDKTEDFYYLMFIRVSGQKFISVVNGKTGAILYKDYQPGSFKIKTKDIDKIYKKIKK